MRIPQWLRTYWMERLWPALSQSDGTAEQYRQVFEQTMSDWQRHSSELTNRPFTDRTIGRYLTETRNWIAELPQREEPENEQRHRKFEPAEVERLLEVFNQPSEWWAALNDRSRETVDQRNHHQVLLPDPEAIVVQIRELLTSQDWAPLAVGLAGATGRRIGEVLLSGSFELKSPSTVWFTGRLKRQGAPEEPFEVSTLCEAALVLDAWRRLRSHPDILAMDLPLQDVAKQKQALGVINQRLYPMVRKAANYYFQDLIPNAGDEEGQEPDLYAHLFRSIFRTIAIWYFCPIRVDPDTFSATILGHTYYQQLKTKKERLNFASEHYYRRFAISDGQGNVDGRRGIRLPEGLIDEFRKEYEMQLAQSGASKPKTRKAEKATEPRVSKTGYSSLRPKSETRAWFNQAADELKLTWKGTDATLVRLLEIYEEHKLCENGGNGTLDPQRVIPQQLALPDELTARIDQAMQMSGQDSFFAFLEHALERESNVQIGLAESRKKRQVQDLSKVPTSQLLGARRPGEARERIRRHIANIILHNRTCADPNGYWFINQRLLREYTGASPDYIKPILAANQAYIDRHHEHLKIVPGHNRTPVPKQLPISEDKSMVVPDNPADIKGLDDIVLPPLDTGKDDQAVAARVDHE
jgi:Telomere resolvase